MKIFFIITFIYGFHLAQAQDELFKPSHGGQELKKSGLSYEVVRKPKEIFVYSPKADAPAPKVITIKFKKKDGTFDKVDLTLMPIKDAGTNIYSAPVPASVYIAGGVTFDLDLGKKK